MYPCMQLWEGMNIGLLLQSVRPLRFDQDSLDLVSAMGLAALRNGYKINFCKLGEPLYNPAVLQQLGTVLQC